MFNRYGQGGLKNQAGQAVAELAVTLFILVLVLFSILELALVLNTKLALASAAREIARVCAVKGGWTEEASPLISGIIEATGLSSNDVEIDIAPRQAIYGTVINVSLSYDYRVKSSVVASISRRSITLTAKAVTRSEFVPR